MDNIKKKNLGYYKEQYWYGEGFIKKFIGLPDNEIYNILEVGPAEGGLLKYLAEKNHNCYGIELAEHRYHISEQLNKQNQIKFYLGDIAKLPPEMKQLFNKMDIIICRDVIEHIPWNLKLKALENMKHLLKPAGKIFISFPPKYSPYAGHQQGAPNIFAKLPFLHLLPPRIYKTYLSLFKMSRKRIQGLLQTRETRISITAFEKMINQLELSILKKEFYLIRPCFESRFNLKRIKNFLPLPVLKEIFTLGATYLLKR